jgi:hypothetical protein
LAYVNTHKIEELAVWKFRMYAKATTYTDLISKGLANGKHQAQLRLRYGLKKKILFTLGDHRPQQYYPTCMESEVMKKVQRKSNYIQPSGLPSPKSPLANCLEPLILQTLEGYVLPLLPQAPLYIHNMHLRTKIASEYYSELELPMHSKNKGKNTEDIVGNTLVSFIFSPNGTVQIITRCDNYPFKIETELDRSSLLIYLGQIKECLVQILLDNHQRAVIDVLDWYLMECDINKDIKVNHLLHVVGLKIQVKHLDHLFRIYIKSLGPDTVCRVEENKHFRSDITAIQAINEIFNPYERIENKIDSLNGQFQDLMKLLKDAGCIILNTNT